MAADTGFTLMSEQQHILASASMHKNLQVLALAGSGKTTVSLHVAKHLYELHGKSTLILSYNKKLQLDTLERVEQMGMSCYCGVKTIHGASGDYANPRTLAPYDWNLKDIIAAGRPMTPVPYNVFIIDEAQDLSELYYQCIHMMLLSAIRTHGNVQIIILGDPLQRINSFRGAESTYLLEPSKYFFKRPFTLCRLTVNFRCSYEIVLYVNNLMADLFERLRTNEKYRGWWQKHGATMLTWWGEGLQPSPQALETQHMYPPPREVMVYSNQKMSKTWVPEIKEYILELEAKGYIQSEIPFIVPTPNCLAAREILIQLGTDRNFYFPDGDVDEDLARNKHMMITVHKMKGGSAMCPIVLSPDNRWEQRALKQQKEKKEMERIKQEQQQEQQQQQEHLDMDDDFDPSDLVYLIYVSISRARQEMMMVYAGTSLLKGMFEPELKKRSKFSVHELCKDSSLVLNNICTMETLTLGEDVKYFHDKRSRMFPGRPSSYGPTKEDYAPVIGYAIEYAMAHGLGVLLPTMQTIFEPIQKIGFKQLSERTRFRELHIALLEAEAHEVKWEHLLKTAVYKFCSKEYKNQQLFRQLVGTHFIPTKNLDVCCDRGVQMIQALAVAAGQPVLYHERLEGQTPLGLVQGEVDFLVGLTKTVVEVKVTQEISEQHLLQALLYSALLQEHFGQPCYVIAPNLNQAMRVTPLPGITADYVLELAVRRKLGL